MHNRKRVLVRYLFGMQVYKPGDFSAKKLQARYKYIGVWKYGLQDHKSGIRI